MNYVVWCWVLWYLLMGMVFLWKCERENQFENDEPIFEFVMFLIWPLAFVIATCIAIKQGWVYMWRKRASKV